MSIGSHFKAGVVMRGRSVGFRMDYVSKISGRRFWALLLGDDPEPVCLINNIKRDG